jgi:RNA polymerase sigma factor (sigma-70 family)
VLLSDPPGRPDTAELDRFELRHGLVAALADLPRQHREVLVLRYCLDLGEDETAAVLGCRRGTVKSRAHRGLRRLAASGHLAGYDIGGQGHAASSA